jgi:hypothetical protein
MFGMIFEEVTGQNGKTNLQIQYARVNWKTTHDQRKVLRASIVGSRQIIEFDEVGGPHNRLWFAGQSWSNHSWERLLLPPQAVADFPFYPVLICCRRGDSKLPPKQLLQERLTRLYQASYARIERHAKLKDKVLGRQKKEVQGGAVRNNNVGSLARPSTLLQPAPRPSAFADKRPRQLMDGGAKRSDPYISRVRREVPNAEENYQVQDLEFVDISDGRVVHKGTSRNALCNSPGSPRPTKERGKNWRLSKEESSRSKRLVVKGPEAGAPGAREDGDLEQNMDADADADADDATDADREDATDAGEDLEEVEDDAVYEEDDDNENETGNENENESQYPHGGVGEAAEDDVEESESGNLVEDSENPDDESNMDLDEDAQSGDAADDSLLGDELDASELDEQEDDQEAEEEDDDGEDDLEDAEDELGLDEAFDEMEDEMADFDDDGMQEFSDGGEMDGGMGYMGDGDGGDFGMGDLDGDTGGDMAF